MTLGATPAEGADRPNRRLDRAIESSRSLCDEGRLVDLLTIAIAAGTSLRTVQSWVAEGRLRVTRLGRCTRVRVSDWLEFLSQRQGAP